MHLVSLNVSSNGLPSQPLYLVQLDPLTTYSIYIFFTFSLNASAFQFITDSFVEKRGFLFSAEKLENKVKETSIKIYTIQNLHCVFVFFVTEAKRHFTIILSDVQGNLVLITVGSDHLYLGGSQPT